MAATKHTVSYDGKIVGTRTSKTRTYEFAVVVKYNDYGSDLEYGVFSWSSRRDLAEKAAAKPRTFRFWDRDGNVLGLKFEWVKVLPVERS